MYTDNIKFGTTNLLCTDAILYICEYWGCHGCVVEKSVLGYDATSLGNRLLTSQGNRVPSSSTVWNFSSSIMNVRTDYPVTQRHTVPLSNSAEVTNSVTHWAMRREIGGKLCLASAAPPGRLRMCRTVCSSSRYWTATSCPACNVRLRNSSLSAELAVPWNMSQESHITVQQFWSCQLLERNCFSRYQGPKPQHQH